MTTNVYRPPAAFSVPVMLFAGALLRGNGVIVAASRPATQVA